MLTFARETRLAAARMGSSFEMNKTRQLARFFFGD